MNAKTSLFAVALLALSLPVRSQENPPAAAPEFVEPIPAAILAFSERGTVSKGLADKVGDLLFASLATDPDLWLVDRQDLEKALGEQTLTISGMVSSKQAVEIGSLTGAKVLITGSVFEVDKDLHIVAKIIGTETTRVLGASVKGLAKDDFGRLVAQLGEKVAQTVRERSSLLVAPVVTLEDRIAALKKSLDGAKLPTLVVSIAERHIGRGSFDPAAETQFGWIIKELGGTIIEGGDISKVEVRILGEGFSEFAMRRGDLYIAKARLELKAVNAQTGEVLAVDRETAVAIDLAEEIAGKKALENAATRIAERMLPKLVK